MSTEPDTLLWAQNAQTSQYRRILKSTFIGLNQDFTNSVSVQSRGRLPYAKSNLKGKAL